MEILYKGNEEQPKASLIQKKISIGTFVNSEDTSNDAIQVSLSTV
jgi:hypothetical protein